MVYLLVADRRGPFAEVSGESARELSDDETLKVVAKEAKKRKESATAYRDAQRPELADREEAELAVLEGYLPEQMGDEELTAIVDRAIEQVGATSMAQMGQVMKLAQGEAAGRADGGAPLRSMPDIQAADFAALTRRYGVEVIAEKVENERQVVDILELDVSMGQGHLFGEPRAIKEQVLAETDPPAEFLRSTLRSAEQRRRFS